MEEDAVWRKVLADENKRRVVTELKERKIGVDGEEWPVSKGGTRDAAVLVPLVMAEGQPSVLFTVRSQHVSRHRQQVRWVPCTVMVREVIGIGYSGTDPRIGKVNKDWGGLTYFHAYTPTFQKPHPF